MTVPRPETKREFQFVAPRDLVRILLQRRWWLATGAIVGAIVGVAIALNSTPRYRADVLIQPIKRSSGSSIQGLSGQLGSLAGLAGLDLGGSDETVVAKATLESRLLTNAFISDKNLLPVLYADAWDSSAGKWKVSDPRRVPTVWAAEQYFSRHIRRITEIRSSGLIVLSIEWTDPEVAAQWAGELVARANEYLRAQAQEYARRNIDFLEKQLDTTGIIEVRQALNRLIEEQWKQLMLAQGGSEYAFKTIDPAVIPKGKINWPRKRVAILWLAAGLLLASIVAVAERVVWSAGET